MAPTKSAFNLSTCARPNVLSLKPYRCARDDYKDDGTNVLLDANENAHGPGLALEGLSLQSNGHINGHTTDSGRLKIDLDVSRLNRYPDPHQIELKERLCALRNTHYHTAKTLSSANLFVGNGSDEAIDALMRCFCHPGKDKILICPPTYGMYSVSAHVNDVEVVHVALDVDHNFAVRADAVNKTLSGDPSIKLVYLCSPGNPTGNVVSKDSVRRILEHESWNGVVVVDEAYVDFAPNGSSIAEWVLEWPNLVVMQTLSKAFGLAGIRCGAAFADRQIATLLNSFKAPYNVSELTSQLARKSLEKEHLLVSQRNIRKTLDQRSRLIAELPTINGVGNFRGGFDANFLLVEMLDRSGTGPSNEVALQVYERLAENKGVVVRFRGKEHGCTGCLRITVGTSDEVDKFVRELKAVLTDIYNNRDTVGHAKDEKARELAANGIVA